MRFYPQLGSGATVQFPLTTSSTARTVENEMTDGWRVQWSDEAERSTRWVCRYQELLPAEWSAIRQLFDDCEGRLGEFVFPDPMANLLAWSEDFARPDWAKSVGLGVQSVVTGPVVGTNAARVAVTGAVAGELLQTVALPGWYFTTFSIWVRGVAASSINLVRKSGAVSDTATIGIDGTWKRVSFSGNTAGGPGSNQFGVAIPAGGAVELFGAQLEAQPSASTYKKTLAASGVYQAARFDADELRPTLTAVDRVQVAVPIVARRGV